MSCTSPEWCEARPWKLLSLLKQRRASNSRAGCSLPWVLAETGGPNTDEIAQQETSCNCCMEVL